MFELPLAGYYRAISSPFDIASFLKLYLGGFWFYYDSFDFEFNFPGYLALLDVKLIKTHFPMGCCLRDDQCFRSWCGNYKRESDVPMIGVGGREVGRMADALALS